MTSIGARMTALLQIRPGEGQLVALMTGMMFAAYAGMAIAVPGIEALFYARFGVEFLPVMYIVLGIVTLFTSLIMTGLLARVDRRLFYLGIPLAMAVVLLVSRVVVAADLTWFYAVLWLSANVFWPVQSLFVWGMASLVCDARQAKRLFPLFGVGSIVGLALGSFLTRPLVGLVGTENLILAWVIGLGIAFLLALRLITTQEMYLESPLVRRRQPSILKQLGQGFTNVRASTLLRWISLSAVSFAILFFALAFPFAQAVSEQFGDEEAMAAFLGTFMGISTGAAVVASLFLANRLYARVGFMAVILIYPVIYLAGFSIMAVSASFAALVIFRFAQMFWSLGVVEGALQATFNVVPPDKREQSRTFITGVASQIGISLAGVMLLFGQQAMQTRDIYLIGVAAALLTIYFIWQARRAYGPAVVAALRAGHAHVFYSEEEPFGGFQQDAVAVSAAIAGIHSQDVGERRIAADILGNLSLPETTQAMVGALDDPDASVRAAILRAIGRSEATPAMLEVAARLQDDDPEVRLQAVITLRQLAPYPRGLQAGLEPLLDDPDPAVRSHVAAMLLGLGPNERAEMMLRVMTAGEENQEDISSRISALEALAYWGDEQAFELAAAGLKDGSPAVRRTSAAIMARIDDEACLIPLTYALGDEDKLVLEAVATALGNIGQPAVDMVVAGLGSRKLEDGALLTLQRLPARSAAATVRNYANRQIALALRYQRWWRDGRMWTSQRTNQQASLLVSPLAEEKWRLLADSLRDKARIHANRALNAMAVLGNTTAIKLAIEDLDSKDATQRANALETLEAVGEAKIVRPLLPLWETAEAGPAERPGSEWLADTLRDDDAWVRAIAAYAAAGLADETISVRLVEMAENDPDALVRVCALSKPDGDAAMESVKSLSTVEQVLFLRRVRLFADLPPADLRQIASVAEELTFDDGAVIARQGEAGDMLYIIVSGEILVTAADDGGHQVDLGRRRPGEYVGEMAIISDEVRMATLTAAGLVRTLCISRKQFREILRLRPEVALAVMAVLSQRLREQLHPGAVVAER